MIYIAAILTGAILSIQSIFLSEMGKKIGLIKSATVHFTSALIFLAVLMGVGVIKFNPGIVPEVPAYAYIGAVIGVFSVIMISTVVAKMSIVKATILIFSGQIIASLIIDVIIKTELSIFKIIGIALIGAGFILNVIPAKSLKFARG